MSHEPWRTPSRWARYSGVVRAGPAVTRTGLYRSVWIKRKSAGHRRALASDLVEIAGPYSYLGLLRERPLPCALPHDDDRADAVGDGCVFGHRVLVRLD